MKIETRAIRSAMQIALLGEIRPNIRAVVFKYDASKKYFMLRYYLDSEPQDADYDSANDVVNEVTSHFWCDIDEFASECVYSELPLSKLDALDGFAFARFES